jgi:hypothetical protein
MLENVPARFAETAATMSVDRDNVMQVCAVVVGEVRRLQQVLDDNDWARMGRCGGDPVSGDAEVAFNERAVALFADFRRDVNDLQALAVSIADAARAYGTSEEEIAAVFRR